MKKVIIGLLILLVGLTVLKWKRIDNYIYFSSKNFQNDYDNLAEGYLNHIQEQDSLAANKDDIIAFANSLGTFLDHDNRILEMGVGKTQVGGGRYDAMFLYGIDEKNNNGRKMIFADIIEGEHFMDYKVKYRLNLAEILFGRYDFSVGIKDRYYDKSEVLIAVPNFVDEEEN